MIDFSKAFHKDGEDKDKDNSRHLRRPLDFASIEMNQDSSPSQKKDDAAGEKDLFKTARSQEESYKKAQTFYEAALLLAADINKGIIDKSKCQSAERIISDFLSVLGSDGQELIEVAMHEERLQDYSPEHNLVNVCIVSLKIALVLGLNRRELMKVGLASFFHDVGMSGYLDLILDKRKLSVSEFQKIKNHSRQARNILENSGCDFDPAILDAIEQEHERMDGSGYPQGLKEKDINMYARIIGFCDVYEALTHKRPHRQAYSPYKAIKIIAKDKQMFDRKVIKAFLEHVGLYPRGATVKLNTKEVARVTKHNPKYPMFPFVEIVSDAQGKKLQAPREVDLSTKSTLYIAECL
jgi:response regulator RpfG family c-di-GMP phosphodiesterase